MRTTPWPSVREQQSTGNPRSGWAIRRRRRVPEISALVGMLRQAAATALHRACRRCPRALMQSHWGMERHRMAAAISRSALTLRPMRIRAVTTLPWATVSQPVRRGRMWRWAQAARRRTPAALRAARWRLAVARRQPATALSRWGIRTRRTARVPSRWVRTTLRLVAVTAARPRTARWRSVTRIKQSGRARSRWVIHRRQSKPVRWR
ncbi:hypothetical protein BamIOP4010DRAFT_0501 [Burkholderia ambifaria IOP40-10]|uniref:Uncharacterized protein n=1 Tax=Burkholderia ambifaria IOP40-10 TaxID=396596 RepID=B1F8Z2_9BURK|nr:hypothetical protein BamIOP4010DRAFT_0501 [Burkholderia ambifaria IOP40-10]